MPAAAQSIVMSNHSKWLVLPMRSSTVAVACAPENFKLTAAEQLAAPGTLQGHRYSSSSTTLWRAMTQSPDFQNLTTENRSGDEAPLGADLLGGFRWEDFKRKGAPDFVMRQRKMSLALLYSSGTGGSQGCVLTHEIIGASRALGRT